MDFFLQCLLPSVTRDHTWTHSGDKAGSEWKPHLFCERAAPWVLPLPSLLPTPEAEVLAVTEGTGTAVCPAHPAPSRQQRHIPANKTGAEVCLLETEAPTPGWGVGAASAVAGLGGSPVHFCFPSLGGIRDEAHTAP